MSPRELPLLPVLSGDSHGARSALTCLHRCGSACDKPEPNSTANPRFRSVLEDTIARRSVLKGGAATLGALVVGDLMASAAAAPQRFLTVPRGADACGPLVSEDQLSVFVAVQHPGETDGATFANPSSTWPHTDDFPRPAVVVAYAR